jgi:hypothetical protein
MNGLPNPLMGTVVDKSAGTAAFYVPLIFAATCERLRTFYSF